MFVAHPVVENIQHATVYLLALAFLTVAWWGYRRERAAKTGLPLGVLLATKNAALMLWPLLIARKRWTALGWGLLAAAVLMIIALPATGLAAWGAYAAEAAALTSNPLLAVTAYQSQLGFFRHLTGPGGAGIGDALINAPFLALAAPWAMGALLFVVSLAVARQSQNHDCVFAAFVLLGLVLSPVSSEAHYAMALLPVALLASELQTRSQHGAGAWILLAGAFMVAADVPYRSPGFVDGARAILAYPRLYGALLLWGLALVWSGARHFRNTLSHAPPTEA